MKSLSIVLLAVCSTVSAHASEMTIPLGTYQSTRVSCMSWKEGEIDFTATVKYSFEFLKNDDVNIQMETAGCKTFDLYQYEVNRGLLNIFAISGDTDERVVGGCDLAQDFGLRLPLEEARFIFTGGSAALTLYLQHEYVCKGTEFLKIELSNTSD